MFVGLSWLDWGVTWLNNGMRYAEKCKRPHEALSFRVMRAEVGP